LLPSLVPTWLLIVVCILSPMVVFGAAQVGRVFLLSNFVNYATRIHDVKTPQYSILQKVDGIEHTIFTMQCCRG
jgi:hypothetical protein